jgi:hypothetical protein
VTPTFDRITAVNLGGDIIGGGINPAGLDGQLFLVIDRSGTSTNNNIYMLASVEPNGASNGTDVMFARSTDGGQTFSAPHQVNDDPINHNKWHWFGTISVAPNGRIDSVWLDSRNAANNTDSQLFYSYSVDGGVTWQPNVAVSTSFNPFIGYPNQSKIGDYMTIVSDNTGGSVAYPATFNNEEDVYYVRIPATAPVPQSAVSRKVQGSAGTFDIPLPLSGNAGIECRRGSDTNFEGHQMIVTFANSVTVSGVTVQSNDGLATATETVSGGVVTVNLSNVTDSQTVTVTLTNVNDGTNLGDVAIPMEVLLGDTNGNGLVNATDIAQTKGQVGQAVTSGNFREDVNADGTVSSSDVAIVKAHSGG